MVCPRCGPKLAEYLLRRAQKKKLGETIYVQDQEGLKSNSWIGETYTVKCALANVSYLLTKFPNQGNPRIVNTYDLIEEMNTNKRFFPQ